MEDQTVAAIQLGPIADWLLTHVSTSSLTSDSIFILQRPPLPGRTRHENFIQAFSYLQFILCVAFQINHNPRCRYYRVIGLEIMVIWLRPWINFVLSLLVRIHRITTEAS